MPRLGPNSGGRKGARRESKIVSPGDYMIAMRWFQRRRAKDNSKDYLSCKFEVIGGRSKGESFFATLGLDLSKQGNVTRWQIYQEAVGNKEEFELGDTAEGTDDEGDANIRRIFLHKPFAAEVEVEPGRGDYPANNSIKLFHFRRRWKPQWETWALEHIEAEASRSGRNPEDYADPDPEQDFGPDDYGQGDAFEPPIDEMGSPADAFDPRGDEPGPPPAPAEDWEDRF